jgi:hypothetical protein
MTYQKLRPILVSQITNRLAPEARPMLLEFIPKAIDGSRRAGSRTGLVIQLEEEALYRSSSAVPSELRKGRRANWTRSSLRLDMLAILRQAVGDLEPRRLGADENVRSRTDRGIIYQRPHRDMDEGALAHHRI